MVVLSWLLYPSLATSNEHVQTSNLYGKNLALSVLSGQAKPYLHTLPSSTEQNYSHSLHTPASTCMHATNQ